MIIRQLAELEGTGRVVEAPDGHWLSRRLLTKKDNMGFSLSDTIIRAGTETPIWYKHHLEAVYCVAGVGEIEDEDGTVHEIREGTMYALNQHDRHKLRGTTDLRLICVFNPPLTGDETHDQDGSYPPASE